MAIKEIAVPDIGDFEDVSIIDVFISAGDEVAQEDSLISLESEKAVLDIPSPYEGTITEVLVSPDDTVSKGSIIAKIDIAGVDLASAVDSASDTDSRRELPEADDDSVVDDVSDPKVGIPNEEPSDPVSGMNDVSAVDHQPGSSGELVFRQEGEVHATPSLRQYARELGVGLSALEGSGPNGRITKQDVQNFVKQKVAVDNSGQLLQSTTSRGIPEIPLEDYSQYGPVERVKLGRIKKVSGPRLHASWLQIPLVTHFDECDITDLDDFRKRLNKSSVIDQRMSILPFVIKAVVQILQRYPNFNATLDGENKQIIRKQYYNIGIAVDTPDGLVVPVVRDVDKKTVAELGEDLADVSSRARDGKLGVDDYRGGSFSISSLGGIGGAGFTPIINAPEVAILGVSRSSIKPVWDGSGFAPRNMLPFSLSYDHRVIDGAEAARFSRELAVQLENFIELLMQ